MSFWDFVAYTPYIGFDRWIDGFGNRFKKLDDYSDEEEVRDKIVVITGANGGLGKVVALQMAKRGAVVVMCCRNPVKTQNAVAEIRVDVPDAKLHTIPLDVGDMKSVRSCANDIVKQFPRINILINNAGIMSGEKKAARTPDGWESQLAINHLGHMLFTMLLLDLLRRAAPSRIVVIGSLMHELSYLDLDDINWEKPRSKKFLNFVPYDDSKKCCMLFAKELSRRLEGSGVRTFTICPGLIKTDMVKDFPWIARIVVWVTMTVMGCNVNQGASVVIYAALAKEIALENGQIYHYRRQYNRANKNITPEDAVKLWYESENLLGLSFDHYFPKNVIINDNEKNKGIDEIKSVTLPGQLPSTDQLYDVDSVL